MDMNMKEYVNWKMSHDVKYGEAEGYPLVLEKCRKNKDLKNLRIYGNSVQDKGKNLFNEETATANIYLDDTGAEHESTATGLRLSDYIEVKPFMNYSLILTNATTSATNARISFYDTEQVFVSQTVYSISAGTSSTKNIQISENIYYVRISFAGSIKFYEDLNPENPIEIQSVGELTKNLFYKDNHKPHSAYINISNNFYGYAEDSTSIVVSCKPNTSYTISHACENLTIFRACTIKDEPPTVLGGTVPAYNVVYSESISEKVLTIVTTEDSKYIVVQCSKSRFDDFIETLQIEEGTTATEYEPYHKYKVPVTARGKNLFNPNLRKNVWSEGLNLKYLPDEDCFVINGTVTEGYTDGIDLGRCHANLGIKVKSGKYYKNSVVFLGGSTSKVVNLYSFFGTNSTGEGIYPTNWEDVSFSSNVAEGYTKSVTSLPNGAYISSYWVYLYNVSGVTFNNFKFRVMLTETDATSKSTSNAPIDYEPYIEPQTFNIYLDEPLGSIYNKNYNTTSYDQLSFENKLDIRKTVTEVWDGTENWTDHSKTYPNTFSIVAKKRTMTGLCSHYKSISSGQIGQEGVYIGSMYSIYITDSRFSTLDEFKAFLAEQYASGSPVTVVYSIYSKSDYIEEPIELPELPKTQANTMIYEVIDTSVQPSNMYGKYVKKY